MSSNVMVTNSRADWNEFRNADGDGQSTTMSLDEFKSYATAMYPDLSEAEIEDIFNEADASTPCGCDESNANGTLSKREFDESIKLLDEQEAENAAEPETAEPETAETETAETETAETETAETETAETETAETETAEPETAEPETAEPETAEPETAEPETAETETTETETTDTVNDQEPAAEESDAEAALTPTTGQAVTMSGEAVNSGNLAEISKRGGTTFTTADGRTFRSNGDGTFKTVDEDGKWGAGSKDKDTGVNGKITFNENGGFVFTPAGDAQTDAVNNSVPVDSEVAKGAAYLNMKPEEYKQVFEERGMLNDDGSLNEKGKAAQAIILDNSPSPEAAAAMTEAYGKSLTETNGDHKAALNASLDALENHNNGPAFEALAKGDYSNADDTLRSAFVAAGERGVNPQQFKEFLVQHDLITVDDKGVASFNQKGLNFNHDFNSINCGIAGDPPLAAGVAEAVSAHGGPTAQAVGDLMNSSVLAMDDSGRIVLDPKPAEAAAAA